MTACYDGYSRAEINDVLELFHTAQEKVREIQDQIKELSALTYERPDELEWALQSLDEAIDWYQAEKEEAALYGGMSAEEAPQAA